MAKDKGMITISNSDANGIISQANVQYTQMHSPIQAKSLP